LELPPELPFLWSMVASAAVFVVLAGTTIYRSHEIQGCTREQNGVVLYDPVCMQDLVRIGEL